MFDPDANMPRINREMAYLTSEIGGRSMNSRLAGTNLIAIRMIMCARTWQRIVPVMAMSILGHLVWSTQSGARNFSANENSRAG